MKSMEHEENAEPRSGSNKKDRVLIAGFAVPARSETLGKGAQTESISKTVEASNLWDSSSQEHSPHRGSGPTTNKPS